MGTSDSRWDGIKDTGYTLLPETTKICGGGIYEMNIFKTLILRQRKMMIAAWEAGNKQLTTTITPAYCLESKMQYNKGEAKYS